MILVHEANIDQQPNLCAMLSCPHCELRFEASQCKDKLKKTLSTKEEKPSRLSAGADFRGRWEGVREAHRLIRKRTKDHIDILEKTVVELRRSQEVNLSLALETRRLNAQLEDENLALRLKLQEATLAARLANP
jgi:hypothetical protein